MNPIPLRSTPGISRPATSTRVSPASSEALARFLDHVEVVIAVHGYMGGQWSGGQWALEARQWCIGTLLRAGLNIALYANSTADKILEQLRTTGVSINIDDFGIKADALKPLAAAAASAARG